MHEFELIDRFFDRKERSAGVKLGIGDDGAVLEPSPGFDQVQVIDTMIAGVHFPVDTSAADIAYRAVAINLSDIAAMGARPRWMTLALTLNNSSEPWLQSFAAGLYEAADPHELALVGGDTTRANQVTVTVTITGEVERDAALRRSGARVGDTIYVTGTIGDAAAGLQLLQSGEHDAFLVSRFLRPTARIATGRRLVGKAHAAIDLSDGLAGDLKKMLTASGVGARVDVEKVPLSRPLRERFDDATRMRLALTGGDDYELCFTALPDAVADIPGITAIGEVGTSRELRFFSYGDIVAVDDSGYRHF
ncbi:MAG TPA: thiamine-phosphate kinase [Woeseiaceae bacterium]|nr:thiamine-phosphate kinase [Woeseiaceae bacterium]